jgi:type IV pilus assembly protein PilB
MAIKLDPNSVLGNTDVKIGTLSDDRLFRLNKVQGDLNRTFQENLTERKAKEYGMGYINLYGYPVTSGSLNHFSKEEVESLHMGVFTSKEMKLFIAISSLDAKSIQAQQEKLKELRAKEYTLEFYFCSQDSMDKLIRSYDLIIEKKYISDDINLTQEEVDRYKRKPLDKVSLQGYLDDAQTTTDILELILTCAAYNQASDIHLEPESDGYNVKMRLDGIMMTMAVLELDKKKDIENRIKLLAKLKINISDIPQDGRFSFQYIDTPLDLRVSMLPSNYGYSVVMRVLGNSNVKLDLESLGFASYHKMVLERAIGKNQGMILTCGPTGSGKTTTLYTILNLLNNGENKIISLEDPVEYKIKGISQTQIDEEKGITFATALRSVLRQDPDIIMVGEIRDDETAQTSVNAALTGHKVLSTIHTNDAVGSLPRMIEMGVKGYLFADAVSVIIGQRLLRKSCPHCTKEIKPDPYVMDIFTQNYEKLKTNDYVQDLPAIESVKFTKSEGCSVCNNTGYKGRVGVYEIFTINQELKIMLEDNVTNPAKIRQSLENNKFITMTQDAVYKVCKGQTDMEEVIRVIV